jgi:aspartate carbamoyltransferase regulatory subunit
MVHLKALFLTFLLPATVWAVDYTKLDHLQTELLAEYQKTLEIAGAPKDIRQSLKNKEDKKVQKSILAIENFFAKYDQYNMQKIDLFMSNALIDVRAKYLGTKIISRQKGSQET